MQTAKSSGPDEWQAVRLPKEFPFDPDGVRIWVTAAASSANLIARDWAWLDVIIGPVADDFIAPRDAENRGTS